MSNKHVRTDRSHVVRWSSVAHHFNGGPWLPHYDGVNFFEGCGGKLLQRGLNDFNCVVISRWWSSVSAPGLVNNHCCAGVSLRWAIGGGGAPGVATAVAGTDEENRLGAKRAFLFVWNDELVVCIGQHGVTRDEFEEVVLNVKSIQHSRASDRPMAFGPTSTGKFLACVFEYTGPDQTEVLPVTAFEIHD